MYLLTGMSRNAHRVLPKSGKPAMINGHSNASYWTWIIIVWYIPTAISSGSGQFGNL